MVRALTDDVIEAAARALYDFDSYPMPWGDEIEEKRNDYRELATTVLAAVTPLIRAAALEEAARAFEPDEDGHDAHSYRWTAEEIAAAIRSLKEQPPSPRTS
jgi:hypothetical protein